MKIEILVLDKNEYETDRREFDSVKEAVLWVKQCGLNADYWDRRAEVKDWHIGNVATIQLLRDGEVERDWFPFEQ